MAGPFAGIAGSLAPTTPTAGAAATVAAAAKSATIRVNGKAHEVEAKPGRYAEVRRKWKAGDVDCYALMTGTMPTYTLRGFFTKEATMKDCNLQNLGHGEGYVVPQALLLELDDIYKLTPASYCA